MAGQSGTYRIGRALLRLAAGAAIAVGLASTSASADDYGDDPNAGLWQLTITPYAWLTGVSGEVKARGQSFDVNAGFIDLVQQSDWILPIMVHGEARKDRFSIFTDVFYTQMQFTQKNAIQRNPFAETSVKIKSKTRLTQTLGFAQLAAGYEVARIDQGVMGPATLELLGGARYWFGELDAKLNVDATVKLPKVGLKRKKNAVVARSGHQDWIDPIVGFRVVQGLSEGKEIRLLGDIGGFGVGSDLTWQIFGGYSAHTPIGSGNTQLITTLGYRAIGFDYSVGSGANQRTFDMVLHGPIAGLSLRW